MSLPESGGADQVLVHKMPLFHGRKHPTKCILRPGEILAALQKDPRNAYSAVVEEKEDVSYG